MLSNTVFLINASGGEPDKPAPDSGEVIQMPPIVTEAGKVGEDTTFRRMAVAHPNGSDDRLIETWLYHAGRKEIEELTVSLTDTAIAESTAVAGHRPTRVEEELLAFVDGPGPRCCGY